MKPHAIGHAPRPLPTHHVTGADDGDGDGGDDVRWRRGPGLIHEWQQLAARRTGRLVFIHVFLVS